MGEFVEESLDNAKKELRRADHLFFVSLKYTRTVDVLKSLVARLINTFQFGCATLLQKAQDEHLIEEVPDLPRVVITKLTQLYPTEEMKNFLNFYLLLRKIDRAEFERAREFRRHVTMTAFIDDKKIEVTIDIAFDYYTKTKEFLMYIDKIVLGKTEDED